MVQRTLTRVLVIGGLFVAATAGCGDDDDATTTTARAETTTSRSTGTSTADTATDATVSAADATEADYLAAIERSLSSGDGLSTTPEQAECMAPKWLDTIGVDRLKDRGVAPSEIGDDVNDDGSALSDLGLTDDEGTALYDAFGECDVDIRAQFVEFATDGQPPEIVECIDDALTPDLLRRVMIASIVQQAPDDELQADFEAAIGPCDELSGAATTTAAATTTTG